VEMACLPLRQWTQIPESNLKAQISINIPLHSAMTVFLILYSLSLSLKGAEAQGIICSLLKMQQSTAVIAAGSQDSSHDVLHM